VVADETYEEFVFGGKKFVSFAQLTTKVPVLLCSGLSKRYLVPGWRTGWIVLIGPSQAFTQVK
jgi:tyrosine aminotransferase